MNLHDQEGVRALRWSVALALGVGLTTTGGVAFAQDADDADEDLSGRVEVTGSRIKRADIEGALPVTVIDRNQIELSGQTSVADLLRNTTFNSFGSFRPASGSSAQSFAGLSLRGLGSQRTLILIDGRRAPTARPRSTARMRSAAWSTSSPARTSPASKCRTASASRRRKAATPRKAA